MSNPQSPTVSQEETNSGIPATSPTLATSAPASAGRKWLKWSIWGLFGLLLLAYPFVAINVRPWMTIANLGIILAIGALGLNVLAGYTGLASLGHAFFLGVGAYTCMYFGGNLGWSFLLWLPLAGVIAGVIGLLIGAITLRFRGFYLTIMTLGMVFIGGHIFLNWKEISGGSQGKSVPAPAIGDFTWAKPSAIGPIDLNRDQKFYFLALPILILAIIFVSNLMRTRMGRAFQAVRDREVAAELMGIDASRTKITAFVVSSVLGGICGALYGSFLTYLQPEQFGGINGLEFSIRFIAMIIIGGIASVPGAIIGALLLTAAPELISTFSEAIPFIQKGAGTGGITSNNLSEILYALLLGVFLIFEPTGIIGIYRRIKARVLRSKIGKYLT